MKIRKTFLFVAILGLWLQNCTSDQEIAPEKVQFTFNLQSSNAADGRTTTTLPAGAHLLLTLEKSNGETVFTRHRVNLLSFGNGYSSEPLDLSPGTYRITEFMLADEMEKILYATPVKGAPLASAVVHALPYGFTVSRNKLSNIEMEVVNVSNKTPEDFGYASFSIHAINTFSISVFTIDDGKTSLASAEAYILHDADTVNKQTLTPAVNTIAFEGDPDETYELVVIKSGYARYQKQFTCTGLQAELGGKALKVTLAPAFTMTKVSDLGYDGYLELGGSGEITVDWGDGHSISYNLTAAAQEFTHEYNREAGENHFVTVTGELDKITIFRMWYDNGGLTKDINLQHLTNLQVVDMGEAYSPADIDLRYNTRLTSVSLESMTFLKHVALPEDHKIKTVNVGSTYFSTEEMDAIIDNIHSKAVLHNIIEGQFVFRDYYAEEESPVMMGPPSPAALNKLRELRDTYGWHIDPNLD